jgi:hypothetical protein
MLSKKIDELDKESDIYSEDVDDSRSRRAALRYNYALRSKELDLQREEHTAQVANAEAKFCHEHDLKVLDLEMKKVEEQTVAQQIELLRLQIQLKTMSSSSSSGPSTGADVSANLPGA